MKIYNYIGIMAVAAGMLSTVTSCKDDWNLVDAPSATSMSAGNTLWENIQLDENLTQFATLVKKAGYADVFSSSKYYTVWAPKNGTFNYDELIQQDSATLRNTFIENVVAEYAHNLSGDVNEKVMMLNDKSYLFSSLTGTIDDVKILKSDIASCNGIMHETEGNVVFRYSIYEMFDHMTDTLFAQYFKGYETKKLNTKKSTIGPIVNGVQTYLDSVMDINNTYLFSNLKAKVDKEDSTYTVLIPTDKAWTATYNKILALNKTHNVMGKTNYSITYCLYENSSINKSKASTTINYEYYTDSLAKQAIACHMFFNNNDKYNAFLLPDASNVYSTDTLHSTTGRYFYDAQNILAYQKGDAVKASNGYIRYVDSIAIHPWQTYDPSFSFYPSDNNLMRNVASNSSQHTIYREDWANDAVLQKAYQFEDLGTKYMRYMNFERQAEASAPEVDVYLPNVRSRKYHICAVIVPALFDDTLQYNSVPFAVGSDGKLIENGTKRKPNSLKFTLYYTDAKNKVQSKVLKTQTKVPTTTSAVANYDFCDPNKVDTVDLGEFEFPISYYGTEAKPYIEIKQTQSFTFVKANRDIYEQSIRLAAILLYTPEYEAYNEQRKKK